MNRITNYLELKTRIVNWIKNYVVSNDIKALVVGVSGGIDSAVVSTLCAETGFPTYVLSMPLLSSVKNDMLSNSHVRDLETNYPNVTKVRVELSEVYEELLHSINLYTNDTKYTSNDLTNANTKSRIRMVTLYQVAGSVGGIVVGTGNKVEDYGIGFYTKYGDGGVDIAPIADLYKTEVWMLGEYLGIDERIISAPPTDGLWEDDRTDQDQIGASYEELELAMETGEGPGLEPLLKFSSINSHKMNPIPTFKL